jgi:hypothetical protein
VCRDAKRAVRSVGASGGVNVRKLDRHENDEDAAKRKHQEPAEFGKGLHESIDCQVDLLRLIARSIAVREIESSNDFKLE